MREWWKELSPRPPLFIGWVFYIWRLLRRAYTHTNTHTPWGGSWYCTGLYTDFRQVSVPGRNTYSPVLERRQRSFPSLLRVIIYSVNCLSAGVYVHSGKPFLKWHVKHQIPMRWNSLIFTFKLSLWTLCLALYYMSGHDLSPAHLGNKPVRHPRYAALLGVTSWRLSLSLSLSRLLHCSNRD